jgi:photosystem II stability/assembly factor-like uncharacterized protein
MRRPRVRLVAHAAAAVATIVLSAAPARGLDLFGLADTGELFVSEDAGGSWAVRSVLPVRDAAALIAGATASDLYLVSRSGSFFASADAGLSWSATGAVPAPDIAALVPCPGRLLLLTSRGAVFASLDAGVSFTAVATIAVPDLVAGTRLGGSVFAAAASGAIYRSDDDGVGWTAVGRLPVTDVVAMATLEGGLHVLTATGDLARSDDLGVHWSFVSTLSQSGLTSLLAGAGELLACTAAGEVAASADGTSWLWRGSMGQLTIRALASDLPFPASVGPGRRARPEFTARPNPAPGAATLAFDLAEATDVTVRVFDLAGREVARPITGERIPAGVTTRVWRPDALAAGLYFIRAVAGEQETQRRLVLLGRP